MIGKALDTLRTMARLRGRLDRLEKRLDRIEQISAVSPLTPIDRHIALHAAFRADGVFDLSYPEWRTRRIDKLLALFGTDWFVGKRVLELGAGLCEIGAFFADIGANVTCLEGRPEQVQFARLKHRNVPRITIQHCDLENDFSRFGRFDLILHFGLLYHLAQIDQHMATCFAMSDDIVLETVVCDSADPHCLVQLPGRVEINEESLHGMGCRPSAAYVERLAEENGFSAERHFTRDLNAGAFIYDWTPKNDGNLGDWNLRRFWRLRRTS